MTQNARKLIFSLMASTMLLPAQAQDVPWFEPDHEWFYKIWCSGGGSPGPCGYHHFTIEPEDTIGGFDASVLLLSAYDESGNLTGSITHYFRTSGDSIFHYYEPSEIWYLLYSFNTPVGESWVIQGDTFVGYGIEDQLEYFHFEVMVDSVDILNIGGVNRKIIYTSSVPDISLFNFNQGIIEGIGGVGESMFGDNFSSFGLPGSFSCFIENEEIIYGPFGYPCLPVSTENSVLNNLEIFPNPANDRFTISFPENSPVHFELRLYDLSGRLVHSELHYKADQMINLTDFSPGLYILQASSGQEIFSGKLVVE